MKARTILMVLGSLVGLAASAGTALTAKIAETHKVLGTDVWYGCRRTGEARVVLPRVFPAGPRPRIPSGGA